MSYRKDYFGFSEGPKQARTAALGRMQPVDVIVGSPVNFPDQSASLDGWLRLRGEDSW